MESAGEIFFRCTACRRRLAAEPRAVGHLVSCPNCQSSLRVPETSTAMDPLVLRRRLALAFVALGFLGCGVAGWALAQRAPNPPMSRLFRAPAVSVANPTSAPAAAQAKSAVLAGASGVAGPTPTPSTAEDRRALQRLQQENRAIGQKYEDLANWVLSNLRGRFLLKQQHVGKLRFAPVNEDFSVSADLADFLAASANESAQMTDVFQYSRDALIALQHTYMSATQDAPDRVTLYIPPFEREGAALRDELYGALEGVLGADRFGRLLAVGEKDMSRAYDYFGAASRTLVFEKVSDPNVSAKPYLIIKDGWVIPRDESRRTTETTEEAVTELPERYSSYLAWLPDFIAAYAKP
ncbi:MAG: hypothetical protein M9963_08980 [Kiritimatiellae bacterium]|nr:hypothetical protein [Kiritimatiellia bacterium]